MLPTARPYQSEDVCNVIEAHKAHRHVLGRAATGLGKAFELALLAKHYAQYGRVIIIVDLLTLCEQLADTVKWVTGHAPGVEAADRKATRSKDCLFGEPERIIVAMAQTLVSADRYKDFPPGELSAVLLDECETFVPPDAIYRKPISYWMDGNPGLVCYGNTATPTRSDGVAMAELFEHVAVDRDILWGIDNGWLVPVRQGFVQVELDLSKLKLSKNEFGSIDFSEDDIAEKINNNKTLVELATGIIKIADDRRTIVTCPKKEICEALAGWINKLKPKSANFLHSGMSKGDQAKSLAGHKDGQFQFLTSVMMLTKGYDDPQVSCVVNCRKTKSWRLYQQILGRGTRALAGTLDGLEEAMPLLRREMIQESDKPDMLMVNMVGLEQEVMDITAIDILGTANDDPRVVRLAKEIARDGEADPAVAMATAQGKIDEETEANQALSEMTWATIEDNSNYATFKKMQEDATVSVEWETFGVQRARMETGDTKYANSVAILERSGWPSRIIESLGHAGVLDKARETIRRHKAGLATYKQCRMLMRNGWSKEAVQRLDKAAATTYIDGIMANHR